MFMGLNMLSIRYMTSPKQKSKYVEARLKGASKTAAALIAKPEITPKSAPNTGARLEKDPDVQSMLTKALEKHNITIDRTTQIISEAMSAEKVAIIGKGEDAFADVMPDHTVRLKAADMAHGLMGLKTTKPPVQDPRAMNPGTAKELAEAIRSGDEVRVTQAVWKKKDGS